MPRTAFVALLVAALAVGGARCQPPGSNPGLPPSATATGLAAQKITDMTGGCIRLGLGLVEWWDWAGCMPPRHAPTAAQPQLRHSCTTAAGCAML